MAKINEINQHDGTLQVADNIYNNYSETVNTPLQIDHKILYLSACSKEENDLRFTTELATIKRAIDSIREYKVQLEIELAVQISQIQKLIKKNEPDILHISVHGDLEKGLLFLGTQGEEAPLSKEDFNDIVTELLGLEETKLKLVVLSACNSVEFAEVLLNKVDAIGMDGFIPIDAANIFAEELYSWVLNVKNFNRELLSAFNNAKRAIKYKNFPPQSGIEIHKIPYLFKN